LLRLNDVPLRRDCRFHTHFFKTATHYYDSANFDGTIPTLPPLRETRNNNSTNSIFF
jgi:hypothetical protein